MKVLFRADASTQIGTGHVMRCLTLANALRSRGARCSFVCREHVGHLVEQIRVCGHEVHALPLAELPSTKLSNAHHDHAAWLGADWATDAQQTLAAMHGVPANWLVVDHYALDDHWEKQLRPHCDNLLVIDDLADRPHTCDLLLDQTFGREAADYRSLVPAACRLLCGSQYALLRPEFAALRSYSLQRRAQPSLRELLITMGGIDKDNATGLVLQALRTSLLPVDCRITVVMGTTALWLSEVRKQAQDMPWQTRVLVGVGNMAQLMADSDLAIGAAGATSWERCCLGLPSIMLVLAENQRTIARCLERSRAAMPINLDKSVATQLRELIVPLSNDSSQLLHMGECAARIVDGLGINAVMQQMEV